MIDLKNILSISQYNIDSCTAICDLSNVLVDKRKINVIDAETGEVIDEKYQGYEFQLYDSLDVYLYINFLNHFGTEKVAFTINSKMLGINYKKGVSKDAFLYILSLYEQKLNIRIFDKSIDKFNFIDVDIFTDLDISYKDHISNYLMYVKKNILFNARIFFTSNTFDKIRELKGFQFNNRRDSSSNHFFKFYLKQVEIEEKETMLKFVNFFGLDFSGTSWRFEFTIRNSYAKEFFNYKTNLDLFENYNHQKAALKLLNHVHFFKKDPIKFDRNYLSKKYSFNILIVLLLFLDQMEKGKSFNEILTLIDIENLPYSDASKSRKKMELRNNIIEILKYHKRSVTWLKKDFYLNDVADY